MKVAQILEGWTNYLIPPKSMKELIEAVHEERIAICNSCSENTKNINPNAVFAACNVCKCPLSSKTRALTTSCPLNKWSAILTQEERDQMEEKIKSKSQSKEDEN